MVNPFKLIPGPQGLPVLGTLPFYTLGKPPYAFNRLCENGKIKFKQYGPIVKEKMAPGTDIVWLFDPEDVKTMFEKAEGKMPSRRSHLALAHYRLSKPEMYANAGLLPTNGPEWSRIRKQFQFRPDQVDRFMPAIEEAADDFVRMLKTKRENVIDILPELKKFFLETTVIFLFEGARLGSIEPELRPDSRAARLIKAATDTNDNILTLDNSLQMWKKFETPRFRTLRNGQETIETIAEELMNENGLEITKDTFTYVSDMLLAGIDTSAYTTAFLLHHLSRRPDVQITVGQDRAFSRLALKESLRLNPISVGVGRITAEQVQLSGFDIPAGSNLVSQNEVMCRSEKYFARPLVFDPERWSQRGKIHAYLSVPFGHGRRACIGRRLAERGIFSLVERLANTFNFTWAGQNNTLGSITKLINRPDAPVLLKLDLR